VCAGRRRDQVLLTLSITLSHTLTRSRTLSLALTRQASGAGEALDECVPEGAEIKSFLDRAGYERERWRERDGERVFVRGREGGRERERARECVPEGAEIKSFLDRAGYYIYIYIIYIYT